MRNVSSIILRVISLKVNQKMIKKLASDTLYRNSFFMAFSSAINAGCGFIFWIIAAHFYTIEQVGVATALISSLGLVILFSRLGFDFSIIRFISLENKWKVISTSLSITTASCILMGAIFILMADLFSSRMNFLKEPAYALSFLLIATVNSLASVTGNAFVADRKADYCLLQNLFMALRIPALIPIAFLGVFGIIGSLGVGFLVASLFGLLAIQRTIAVTWPKVDRDFIHRSFWFSFWNYISSILSAAPTLVIPIMVLNMLGEAEAARYYIAFAIGNMVLIVPGSLGNSLFVEGSHGENLTKSVFRAGIANLALLVPAVLILLLFGDNLLGMLNKDYLEASEFLNIIILSCFPVAIFFLFVSIQNVRMNVKGIVKLNALRCVLLLALSYILMQRYGILGVGYAWMATYCVIMLEIGRVAWKEGWMRTLVRKNLLDSTLNKALRK